MDNKSNKSYSVQFFWLVYWHNNYNNNYNNNNNNNNIVQLALQFREQLSVGE